MVAMFSGRFDPPHLGHLITIGRIHQMEYGKIIIVILDYPERGYPAQYAKQILTEALSNSKIEVEIIINTVHFAKITHSELKQLSSFNAYFSGNMEVLKHISNFGVKTKYVDRAYHYAASDQRIIAAISKAVS